MTRATLNVAAYDLFLRSGGASLQDYDRVMLGDDPEVKALVSRTAQLLLQAEARMATMATVMIIHDVDDVDHWLSSPKRHTHCRPNRNTMNRLQTMMDSTSACRREPR